MAIPIFLFVRSVFFQRTTRVNKSLKEFKKQANLAVSIFLFLIVCVVVFAAGQLARTVIVTLNASTAYRGQMVQRTKKKMPCAVCCSA